MIFSRSGDILKEVKNGIVLNIIDHCDRKIQGNECCSTDIQRQIKELCPDVYKKDKLNVEKIRNKERFEDCIIHQGIYPTQYIASIYIQDFNFLIELLLLITSLMRKRYGKVFDYAIPYNEVFEKNRKIDYMLIRVFSMFMFKTAHCYIYDRDNKKFKLYCNDIRKVEKAINSNIVSKEKVVEVSKWLRDENDLDELISGTLMADYYGLKSILDYIKNLQ